MEPLGLPRGSVRAIITLGLLGLMGTMLFVPIVPGADDLRTGLIALAVMAVRDYFQVRSEQNREEGPVVPQAAVNQ